jgi:hypothetical protein
VVVPLADAAGTLRLVGYVTPERPDVIEDEAILGALRGRLSAHLVPDAIVALRAFPLTRNGKLDRAALPAPPTRAIRASAVAPPTTEVQQQLNALWETLLDVRPIGIRDNFFALGGHSLLAVGLIGEIERRCRTRLPLAVLFEQPTIEGLADALSRDPADLNRKALVALNAAGTALPFFYHHGSLTGGGHSCLRLAEQLGTQQPVFIIRPHGVDGGAIPPTI